MPNRYKHTEVGVIPADWKVDVLEETASLKARIGWQGLTTAEYRTLGDYLLITGTEFRNGQIEWDDCFFVDKKRYGQDRNIQINKNDILVTKDGTIGKVAFISNFPKPATLNSGVFVIRPKNKSFDPKYFFFILRSEVFKNFLSKLSAGSTINHLYQKDFVNFKFQKPVKIEEQKVIAEALSDLDSLIHKNEKLIVKKRAIKQGVMQELLTCKRRLPGFSEKWEVKKLGELAEIISGGTPSTSKQEYWDGGILWCTPTDITGTESKYIEYTEKTISKKGLENSSVRLLPVGSLLLCSRATIGEVRITKKEITTNQGFKSLVPLSNVDNEYLYYLILNKKSKLIEKANGSTFLEISKKDTYDLLLRIPSDISEQKAISKILSNIDLEIEELKRQSKKYNQIKQGAMQVLLTGKIRLIKN